MTTVNKHRTGVSSSYADSPPRDAVVGNEASTTRAGLVLLYAPNFHQFHPAYPFQHTEVTLGRDPQNGVSIPEQAVSRQHSRIQLREGRWVLSDLGSRNGTMVGGRFITEVELQPNDEIRIGDAIFKFVREGAERFVGYRMDGQVAGARRAQRLTELIGGAQMDQIAADIERIAPTELSSVVLGETGTGKEVVARGLHRLSGRKGSLQAINCAAIPPNLLESELFGYRRGAFSGADRDKPGLIKLADGGTLFLDEIGDMPLDAQAKLLRVLQSREVFPLGATTAERVDIRVVCATHRDLYQYVREGKFRGDLFARLNEHVVRLPPLRERKEDVYQLALAFGARYGRPDIRFTFSFMVALLHHEWPFNVRELESCIKRGVALTEGFLPPALATGAVPFYAQLLQEVVTGLDRIAEAHGRMVLGGSGRTVENLLVLELANTAQPRLAHMLAQEAYHPAELFLELAGLAGRMATYGSGSRRMTTLPAYDHLAPTPAFAALTDTLRSLILSLRYVEPKSRALAVRKRETNVWAVRIDSPEILDGSRIVVRVGSELSDDSLRKIFVHQVTVGSAGEFDTLWKSRLPGIALKPLHSQPREIPYDGDRLCLELDQKSEHWGSLRDSPGFMIGVSGALPSEPQLDCFAVHR